MSGWGTPKRRQTTAPLPCEIQRQTDPRDRHLIPETTLTSRGGASTNSYRLLIWIASSTSSFSIRLLSGAGRAAWSASACADWRTSAV
jgi:hypothetical protein